MHCKNPQGSPKELVKVSAQELDLELVHLGIVERRSPHRPCTQLDHQWDTGSHTDCKSHLDNRKEMALVSAQVLVLVMELAHQGSVENTNQCMLCTQLDRQLGTG